eukprot:gene11183-biopygen16842
MLPSRILFPVFRIFGGPLRHVFWEKRQRTRTGRGPDAGRTIGCKETDADRTRTGRWQRRFSHSTGPARHPSARCWVRCLAAPPTLCPAAHRSGDGTPAWGLAPALVSHQSRQAARMPRRSLWGVGKMSDQCRFNRTHLSSPDRGMAMAMIWAFLGRFSSAPEVSVICPDLCTDLVQIRADLGTDGADQGRSWYGSGADLPRSVPDLPQHLPQICLISCPYLPGSAEGPEDSQANETQHNLDRSAQYVQTAFFL